MGENETSGTDSLQRLEEKKLAPWPGMGSGRFGGKRSTYQEVHGRHGET